MKAIRVANGPLAPYFPLPIQEAPLKNPISAYTQKINKTQVSIAFLDAI